MVVPPGPTWPGVLSSLVAGNDLDAETATWAMSRILAGEASDVQIAGFAVALRSKGESVSELSGLAAAMLEVARPIEAPNPSVDIVGSGGDRTNTVNISTMAAVVAASAGARVVKHGNRAASSACGSADVLEALGVRLDLSPEDQQRVIERIGIGFLFAPHYHGSLRNTASARSQLGIATTFNFLGPLTNPGRPNAHAVGVADERMAELSARVLAERGDQGLVFHGTDGLDELTTTTTSTVFVFDGDKIDRTLLDPQELGIAPASVSELVGGGPADNAAIARRVFSGETGPVRDIVLLNAAAALAAFDGPGPADSLRETLAARLERAAEAIDTGATAELLDRWIAATA
ncbi:anthranilate phosphoribosyltransferase [Microlunatus sp. Gsoil 973]|jgi:anthranilate phosphoribosyltransferase|uniref:anthranilate phosphoribosyltransferase n=1 Tax=Microlunatus sp. Gsoil 973 TaxID=2672569 RepID=UPI0012B44F30|nr:anthranilate phosphoribosyltransferase [Microlunatus sp. Gsoil 973]QGN33331.1 anthranilate phosphoribosyltransferase [Microlunatus sp. Gsoil 973]